MIDNEFLNGLSSSTFFNAVTSLIGKTCIVDFGIVKEVNDGVVTVEMSVARNNRDLKVITCALANITGTAFSINVVPEVDDKVIVLFPKSFDNDMFEPSNNEPIINEDAVGYTLNGGIAIPFSMFKEDTHKNYATFKGNTSEIKTGNVTVTTSEDGDISIDNTKATITVDKDGNVTIDAKNGKISMKNTAGGSLYDILNGMFQILNTSLATAGSPASHTVVPNQFTQQSTKLSQLMR